MVNAHGGAGGNDHHIGLAEHRAGQPPHRLNPVLLSCLGMWLGHRSQCCKYRQEESDGRTTQNTTNDLKYCLLYLVMTGSQKMGEKLLKLLFCHVREAPLLPPSRPSPFGCNPFHP
jgi:hypothetical protein